MTTFDPKDFTVPDAKPLPVILLLDVSGSMHGAKIHNLNEAVKDMLEAFRDTERGEIEIHVAIITFGAEIKLHQPLVSVNETKYHNLSASGGTPLGTAFKMAKAMIEDKEVLPKRTYRPTVVLVSDGRPGDNWKPPLKDFISEGRSSQCERMAMAIGADADEGVLGEFIEGMETPLFYAENAKQLHDVFKYITMSVTIRTQSQDPNVVPGPNNIEVKPATIDARSEVPKSSTQASSGETGQDEQPSEEGYW